MSSGGIIVQHKRPWTFLFELMQEHGIYIPSEYLASTHHNVQLSMVTRHEDYRSFFVYNCAKFSSEAMQFSETEDMVCMKVSEYNDHFSISNLRHLVPVSLGSVIELFKIVLSSNSSTFTPRQARSLFKNSDFSLIPDAIFYLKYTKFIRQKDELYYRFGFSALKEFHEGLPVSYLKDIAKSHASTFIVTPDAPSVVRQFSSTAGSYTYLMHSIFDLDITFDTNILQDLSIHSGTRSHLKPTVHHITQIHLRNIKYPHLPTPLFQEFRPPESVNPLNPEYPNYPE